MKFEFVCSAYYRRDKKLLLVSFIDMDLDIYKLEEKLSKYQKIKQGMMEELLTGKVRLV